MSNIHSINYDIDTFCFVFVCILLSSVVSMVVIYLVVALEAMEENINQIRDAFISTLCKRNILDKSTQHLANVFIVANGFLK